MTPKLLNLNDRLYDYLLDVSLREPDILKQLREETAANSHRSMQISPDQGQFMSLLVKLLGAKKTLDIGVFTGYSSLAVALAMPEEGRVIACDVNKDWTNVARRYWKNAGVEHKIQLRLAPAADTLNELLAKGEAGTFDFAFIDADKENYETYYELALKLLRTGGLVAVDNVLWSGRVINLAEMDADTQAIRSINKKIHTDERVDVSMVPIADGLTLARKR